MNPLHLEGLPLLANDPRLNALYALLSDTDLAIRTQGLAMVKGLVESGDLSEREGWVGVGLCFVYLGDGSVVWMEFPPNRNGAELCYRRPGSLVSSAFFPRAR